MFTMITFDFHHDYIRRVWWPIVVIQNIKKNIYKLKQI